MSNITKVTRGISIDKKLLEVADELLPNRSEIAEAGILRDVLKRIEKQSPESRDEYLKRLSHLLD